jgi:hypothetical protein
MGLKFSNFGKATVSSAPSGTTGLSFAVDAGKGLLFPALAAGDYFYGIFKDASGNREVVKVEARSTDTMTIAVGGRGIDGTTARTWAAGDYFVAGLTNVALQESLSNANLIALGALASAADKLPYFTGSGAAALADISAFIRTLLNDADAATARTTLGALDASLVSSFILTLLNDPDAATARATLGLALPLPIASGGTGQTTAANAFNAIKQPATSAATGVVELSTDAEAQTHTDTTRAITPANLAAVILGFNQGYQDLSGSRFSGVNYTNSTGRTIAVSAWSTTGGITNMIANAFVNGVQIVSNSLYSNGPGYSAFAYFLVPPGATYQIQFGNAGVTNKWFELR